MSPRRRATLSPAIHRHPAPENAATGQPGAFLSLPVAFTIPGKPLSVNAATRSVLVRGRPMALKSREAREFLARAQAAARQAMRGRAPLDGPLTLETIAYWPRRGSDSDNHHKPTKDALQGACYLNDNAVRRDISEGRVDSNSPRVEVTITAYAPPVVAPTPEFVNAWEAVHEHGQGHPRDGAEAPTAGRAYLDGASP